MGLGSRLVPELDLSLNETGGAGRESIRLLGMCVLLLEKLVN
jgi:hypothetical protein